MSFGYDPCRRSVGLLSEGLISPTLVHSGRNLSFVGDFRSEGWLGASKTW